MRQTRLVEAGVAVRLLERLRVRLEGKYRRACEARVVHDGHELVLGKDPPDLIILDQNDVKRVLVHFEGLTDELF